MRTTVFKKKPPLTTHNYLTTFDLMGMGGAPRITGILAFII